MGTINRVPRGLLGLLDAKTGGRTPPDTTGVLSPVIDLTPNYLSDIPFEVAQTAAVVSAAQTVVALVTVPAGELWYCYVIASEFIATASAQILNGVVVLRPPSGTLSVALTDRFITPSGMLTTGAGDSVTSSWTSATPFLAGPGTVFASKLIVEPGASNINCVTSVMHRPVTV